MRWNGLCAAVRVALLGGAWIAQAGLATAAAETAQPTTLDSTVSATPRGSMLERAGSAGAVQVLTREELERSGFVTLGDVLQRLPASGPAQNGLYNNGGNGEQRVNLRQLGTQRTLLLVNGRRWITTLDGSADLSSIPWAAIERVEIAYGSDGARYGSAAVAGTINVVLRSDYEGLEARSWYGRYDEGDGTTQQHDFTVGAAGERGHVVLGAEYAEREPILAGDRAISSVPLFGFDGNNVNIGASSSTPFGRFGVPGTPGSVTLIPGEDGAQTSDFRPFSLSTDGFNFAPDNYLLTPQERIGLFAQGRYAVTDTISFNTTLLYNERRSEQQLAALPITLGSLFGVPATISAQNLYNPFDVNVTSRIQYRPDNRFVRSFTQDADTFHFHGGFTGTFDLADRAFAWDVGYAYSDTETRTVTRGQYDLSRLRQGLGPSYLDPSTGVPTCGVLYIPVPDCVPLNFFGGPDGFTQAMYDYASVTLQDTTYAKQYTYTANLSGDLFELPAGPLGFAAGYEYRRESGFELFDALAASGATTTFTREPAAGAYSLDESYFELNAPIVKDLPGLEIFEVSLAARYSDYSTFGDTTNAQVGFRWKPFADLLVRGSWSDGFRAPTVPELFLGQSDDFPELLDPCSLTAFQVGWIDQATRDRCLSGIVDANGRRIPGVSPDYEQANSQIRTTIGGNPNLLPEQATSRTLGLAYSPSWLDGLEVYLDWYRVELREAIGQRTAQAVIFDCYATPNPLACTLVTRRASGDITNIFHGNENLPGGTEVEGYDLTLRYRFDTAWGNWNVDWDNAYISYFGDLGRDPDGYCRELGVLPSPTDPRICPGVLASGNTVGRYETFFPKWRLKSNLTTTWQYGDWGASLGARYLSALDEDCSIPAGRGRPELCSNPDGSPQNPYGENQLDEIWYFDLQGTWDTPWNGRLTAGVRNLFDKDPPLAFDAFANSFDPQYEVPGRFFYVAYAQRF